MTPNDILTNCSIFFAFLFENNNVISKGGVVQAVGVNINLINVVRIFQSKRALLSL